MRECVKCGVLKPLSAYYRRRSSPDGYAACCLTCGARKAKGDNRRRAERRRTDSDYAARVKAYSLDYCRRVKNEKYGIDYGDLLARQDGRCAICRRTPEEVDLRGRSGEVLHVDHDHACCPGRTSCGACVRGLLCRKCNSAIALFDDNPDRLLDAAMYLTARADLLTRGS